MMIPRIFPEGIDLALKKGLQPFYLLNGQDLLLVNETKDKIVHFARLCEFDEKLEITINNETQWEMLFEKVQSNGLFFSKQILILNLPETLNATQQKHLTELLQYTNPDLLFIIHCPKLSKTTEKQQWFIQISSQGLQINCQTPDIQRLPMWIKQRAKQLQLLLEPEAIQLLCYSYEGNLLALKQALQMLQLRFGNEKINLIRTKEIIEQAAQFTPFQWADALLQGNISRAIRILQHLRNEDTQPIILLRVIQKELFILLEITRSPYMVYSSQPVYQSNLKAEFDRLKIWQNRRELYQVAVRQLSYQALYQRIQALSQLEKQIKRDFNDQIWLELEQFCKLFKPII